MGMEIQIDTLEDMCALMCDNTIPKKESDEENGREKNVCKDDN